MYHLTEPEDWLCQQIKDYAFAMHRELGPGLLEKIYEVCFCYELTKRKVPHQRQIVLPVRYDD